MEFIKGIVRHKGHESENVLHFRFTAESDGGGADTAVDFVRGILNRLRRAAPHLKREHGTVGNHVHSLAAVGDIAVDADMILISESIPLGIDHGHGAAHHGNRIDTQFRVKIGEFDHRINRPEQKNTEPEPEKVEPIVGRSINFQYTFDNFIVGTSNKFAHAACVAVANHPADNYNPLFIYGPSGLGKTHLMSAIVNEIKRKNPKAKVVYIKGEEFTNEMIESLANKTMNKFHEKYRTCDILLIDDIQFIAGKTSTQEEFFHTFNTLHENCSQIVLSSDRPPKDIATLEDRLKTRFEWGLIADIQPPDLELRIAIIKKKAEQADITLSDEVATFLAENLRSNIRQIEGTIKKLSVLAFVEGRAITMDIAASCLQELTGGVVPTQVIIDKIFTCIQRKYGIDKKTIVGKSRTKEVAFTRHVAIYLIHELTEMSYPSVGKIVDRNHSTVIASCEIIEKKIATDPLFLISMSDLKKDIEGLDTV